MADGSTTIYGFVLPEVNASADTWGTKLNTSLRFIDYLLGNHATSGSANAYTLTTGFSIASYVSGATLLIKPNFTNSGAATFNLDGLGTKAITKNGATALASGELISGRVYKISYDGTQWQVVGGGELDAKLKAIADLTWADDRTFDLTGSNTIAVVTYATVGANIGTVDLIYSDSEWRIAANTSDGADSSVIRLLGGGSASTAGSIARGGSIDIAGNEHANAGAVNIRGGNALGGILLDPNGGIVRIVGTTTNDSATAGDVGQVISSTIVSGSAVSQTSATKRNLTSISLTAGDWDLTLKAYFVPANTTVTTAATASISQTSATDDLTAGAWDSWVGNVSSIGLTTITCGVSQYRVSLASTTTIYAVTNAVFTTSTMTVWGILTARRRR